MKVQFEPSISNIPRARWVEREIAPTLRTPHVLRLISHNAAEE